MAEEILQLAINLLLLLDYGVVALLPGLDPLELDLSVGRGLQARLLAHELLLLLGDARAAGVLRDVILKSFLCGVDLRVARLFYGGDLRVLHRLNLLQTLREGVGLGGARVRRCQARLLLNPGEVVLQHLILELLVLLEDQSVLFALGLEPVLFHGFVGVRLLSCDESRIVCFEILFVLDRRCVGKFAGVASLSEPPRLAVACDRAAPLP